MRENNDHERAVLMVVEEMRLQKTRLRYTYAEIARRAGLPVGTVQKVLTGATASPRAATLRKLEEVLMPEQAEKRSRSLYPSGEQGDYVLYLSGPEAEQRRRRFLEDKGGFRYSDSPVPEPPHGLLAEPEPSYASSHIADSLEAPNGRTIFGNPRGPYTLTDYYALPDDQRVELIDGYFFRMEAPTALHQELVIELSYRFKDYQKKKRPDCRVFPAPFDVQLDKDKYTMLQPDISVICDKGQIVRRGCSGAPDFVVEILSPSTRTKDMYMKLAKYKNAGVREYWMVDPKNKKVLVYYYEDEDRAAVYDLDARIPVRISGGDLEIDFGEIMEDLRYLTDRPEMEE